MVDDTIICLVCNSPTKSAHFGVEVCRACASFFKRNFESQRKLVCRKADNTCDIGKKNRNMCRLCRFQKCLRLNLDVVLQTRNKEDRATNLPIDLIPSETPDIPILERIALEYKPSFERRRKAEHEIRINRHNLRRVKMNMNIYITSFDFELEAMSVTVTELAQFTKRAFPAYSKLPKGDQKILMKSFFVPFFMAEGFSRSFRMSPDLKYLMKTAIACFDRDKMDEYVTDDCTINELKNSMIAMLEDYNDKYVSLVTPIFAKSNFTPFEINASLHLPDAPTPSHKIPDLPEHLLKLGEAIKMEIIHDLNRYYTKELGLSDYSVRMGNLLTATYIMKEVMTLYQEQARITSMYLNYENTKTVESIDFINKLIPYD